MASCSSVATTSSVDTLPFSFYAFNPTPLLAENYTKIALLLRQATPALTSKHIPELLFLKRKIINLNGLAQPLLQTVEELIARLAATNEQTDEDLLIEKISQLSLEHHHNPTKAEKHSLEKTLITSVEHLKQASGENAPVLARLCVMCEQLVKLLPTNTSWTAFAKVLRIADIFFQQTEIVFTSYLHFDEQLRTHNVDTTAIVNVYKAQKNYQHLHSIEPFLLMCALYFGIAPPKDLNELINVLKNFLWQEFLTGTSKERLFPVPSQYQQACSIAIQPLTLAIILDEMLLIAALVANGTSVKQRDAHGYTPAHLAAIFCNYPALLLFSRLGADFSLPCTTGATVYDILHSLGFEEPTKAATHSPPTAEQVRLYEREAKKTFCEESIFSTSALFRLWFTKAVQTDVAKLTPVEKSVLEQYTKSTHTSAVYLHTSDQGQDLRALRPIKAGELIIDVTGKIITIDEPETLMKKQLFDIQNNLCLDASEMGSSGEYLTQGPPNCCFLHVLLKGRFHQFLYAIRDIAPHERIQHNPGRPIYETDHGRAPFVEANPESVEYFFKTSQNLSYFPIKLSQDSESKKWNLDLIVIENNQALSKRVEVKACSPSELIDTDTKVHYTRAMMTYINDFPEYCLERIQSKAMRPVKLLTLLDALRISRPPHLHDEKAYTELFIRIVQMAPWNALQPTALAKK